MMDDNAINRDIAAVQAIEGIDRLLEQVCRLTGLGFAAVARVTDRRWVACQVIDRVDFGLDPGDELELKTTICDEIRQSGQGVFIDDVNADEGWRTHHTPILYGFRSYVSLPIVLADGSFFGTLCAIDPEPRATGLADIVPTLNEFAATIAAALNERRADGQRGASMG